MMSSPGMEMTNDAFGCSRATQVHMEDLRLVDLTEICPSRRGELTEFRQPLQVQSHLEMPRILVQLGHIQRT